MENDLDGVERGWLQGVPLPEEESDCLEGLQLADAWDLGLDQVRVQADPEWDLVQADPEWDLVRVQVGHPGWLGERLPNMVEEGHHRPRKVVNPGGSGLAE